MELHHADRPRVAGELGHHLAGGQIPELGWGGVGVRTGRALPLAPPSSPSSLSTPHRPLWVGLGHATPIRREVRTAPESDQQPPAPSPGPRLCLRYLHCVVVRSRRQPLPVGAEPQAPHGLAVPLRSGQGTGLT